MSERAPTRGAPPPTPAWTIRIEVLGKRLELLEYTDAERAKSLDEVRMTLAEVVGRDGKSGMVGMIRELSEKSHTSQGKRIGTLEVEVGKLKQTRAQLYVLGTLGLLILGGLLKMLMG